jgi:hypothetical protein
VAALAKPTSARPDTNNSIMQNVTEWDTVTMHVSCRLGCGEIG